MTERAYTVKEIDALREVCRNRNLRGTPIEEAVRTYMLAGLTAEDIRREDAAGPKRGNYLIQISPGTWVSARPALPAHPDTPPAPAE